MTETLINLALFSMLVITALVAVRAGRLFAVAMLSGAFSLLSALLLVTLDAVDVAFTEAAVGAGISTVLMLGTLALTTRREKPRTRAPMLSLAVVTATGLAIFYGTLDMPDFGAADSPAQTGVAADYMARTPHEIGVPNVVTAILASYRGFDTLGETGVVFTAGIGVLLLISGLRPLPGREEEEALDSGDEAGDEAGGENEGVGAIAGPSAGRRGRETA